MRETWVRSLGWEDSPGEGKGHPLQYSGLENSIDSVVHRVTKSQTRMSDFHFHDQRQGHCRPGGRGRGEKGVSGSPNRLEEHAGLRLGGVGPREEGGVNLEGKGWGTC